MTTYYDSTEIKFVGQATELLECLLEKQRILISCANSKKIHSTHVEKTVKEFNELSEAVHELNKRKTFSFYRKYNFFRSGVKLEFKN